MIETLFRMDKRLRRLERWRKKVKRKMAELDDLKAAEQRLKDDLTAQASELTDLKTRSDQAAQAAADNKQQIAQLKAMIQQIPGDTRALTDAAAQIEANNAAIHSTLAPSETATSTASTDNTTSTGTTPTDTTVPPASSAATDTPPATASAPPADIPVPQAPAVSDGAITDHLLPTGGNIA